MGKIYNNLISTGAGFNYAAQQPLDDREVVQSYSDLAELVSSNVAYEGLEVYVVDDKKSYKLIGEDWQAVITEETNLKINIKDGEGLDSIVQKVTTENTAELNIAQSKTSFAGGNSNKILYTKADGTKVGGSNNFVYGYNNTVVGSGTITVGTQNTIGDIDGTLSGTPNRSQNTAVFGHSNNVQKSNYTLVSGYGNQVSNSEKSATIGDSNKIDGKLYTTLFGNGLTATRNYQTLVGANNDVNDTDSLFAVGWGGKNQLAVNENGDTSINGDLSVKKINISTDINVAGTTTTKYLNVTTNTTLSKLTVDGDLTLKGNSTTYRQPVSAYDIVNKMYVDDVIDDIKDLLVSKVDYLGTISSIDNLSTTCGKGDFYRVETNFDFGSEIAHAGDILIALEDNPGQSILSWDLIHTEMDMDINSNIMNAAATDSIIMTYSGDVDETHFGNTNTGESATVLGEANSNTANRALMSGKLNTNNGANSIVGGYKNIVNGTGISSIVTGSANEETGGNSVVSGIHNKNYGAANIVGGSANTVNASTSIISGEENTINAKNSIASGWNNTVEIADSSAFGRGLIVDGLDGKAVIGNYNAVKEDAIFEVGNGFHVTDGQGNITETHRKNAFEVHSNGSVIAGGFRGDKPNGTPDAIPEDDKTFQEIADIDTISIVEGIQSATFGAGNRAYGNWNFIAGKDNKTFQKGSFAFGGKNIVGFPQKDTNAIYSYSAAIGTLNKVINEYSYAIGNGNEIRNHSAIAIGSGNNITAPYGITIGRGLTTSYSSQYALGCYNDETSSEMILVIGNGTSDDERSNAFQVLKDGRAKVQSAPIEENDVVRFQDVATNLINGEGIDSIIQKYSGEIDETHYGNTNTGESAVVFGEANNNAANRALIAGKMNENNGPNAAVVGYSNINQVQSAIVGGNNNENSGTSTLLVGLDNQNSGNVSIIGGYKNKNDADGSVVAGNANINHGSDALVIGYSLTNYATDSIVVGYDITTHNNQQVSSYCLVGGQAIDVSNSLIFAHGLGLKVAHKNQKVLGSYNENKNNTIFELGNGTSIDSRSNAFEVYKDGRATILSTTDNDTDVVNVAYMKQYIKDHFAELMSEYLAENASTAEDISTIFNREA